MNRWKIPKELEEEILSRDRFCIYCKVSFEAPTIERRNKPSWEHIINDESIITRENIAICCVGCNASKGTKELSKWLHSKYCQLKGITEDKIAQVAKEALQKQKAL